MDRREEAAESGFDLPFEGWKREKVVINSLLFIPPARSPTSTSSYFPPFSSTIGRKKAEKVTALLSHGMRYAAAARQGEWQCTNARTHARKRCHLDTQTR